jgi:hypothetical protein
VGANTVQRQRFNLAGSIAAAILDLFNITLTGTEYAVPTRPMPPGYPLTMETASCGPTSTTPLTTANPGSASQQVYAITLSNPNTTAVAVALTDGASAIYARVTIPALSVVVIPLPAPLTVTPSKTISIGNSDLTSTIDASALYGY